jgi:hypothetical protein
MADTVLLRTVRSGFALLAALSSALVVGMERYVWSDWYGMYPPDPFGRFTLVVFPVIVFLGSLGYLTLMGVRVGAQALGGHGHDESENRAGDVAGEGET